MSDETKAKILEQISKMGLGTIALLIVALMAYHSNLERRWLNETIAGYMEKSYQIMKEMEVNQEEHYVDQKAYFDDSKKFHDQIIVSVEKKP